MPTIPALGEKLRYLRSQLYSGRIRQLIRKTGVNRILSKPYWKLVHLLSEKKQVHKITNHEISFWASTFTEFMRFRDHDLVGERLIIKDLLTTLNSNDIFYDIGANVGTYSCFIAAELGPGKTVAFEPEPDNATHLKENLKLNDLDADVIQVALSDTDGTIDMALTGDEAGEGEHAIATDDNERTLEVETAKGDTIIEERGLPKPTVVKIDVEGAELSVLRGLRKTLHENCRLAYVEVHPEKIKNFGGEACEVEAFLMGAGFEVTEISQRGGEIFLRASK
ncbi:hypothetical protein DJ84_08020 [Halorubrum ezzemoulense]|nr:hypothetical protein DJ84_08020 [Halorubrum ezzemoulense]